ncbi:MAG TPA: zinc ribbon domain-containing protein [Vicinamibacterales bacterium]|nr:zinc ribbon domain-containing protein [Vicinamibacterales bacterium]
MPLFDYACRDCGHHFEALVRGGQEPTCPACHGAHLERLLSVFAVGATGSRGGDLPVAPCGACGDPRGPGACSMN